MSLKLLMAVTIFAAAPIVAFAQKDDPANHAPKPTLADAQKVVQTISSDKTKLQAYCDLGKLQDQMEKAEEGNDTAAVDALVAKADALAQQIGPEYLGIVEGLEEVDPTLPKDKSSLPYSIPSTRSANSVAPRHMRTNGTMLEYDIVCLERGAARGHAVYELSTDAFTGRIAMVMGAKNMTMTEVQRARRIGECSPAKLRSARQF